ncbi:MAG: GNAT family N-acetyltransferase [Egibacteraceae bacterium]
MHSLPRTRLAEVERLFADAFVRHDPVFADLWPDLAVRRRALRRFFGIPLRDALAHGEVDAALDHDDGDTLAGVAVWLRPDAYPMSLARKLRATPVLLRTMAAAPRTARRFAQFGANVDARFGSRHAWYLQVLAVEPARVGQGIGSRLLRHGLQRADTDSEPAYLETSRIENVRLYERHGFVIEDAHARLLPDGPTHWLMSRP